MFEELAKSSFELLKLAPRYLISVALISGALLFFSESWLERIGLDSFAKDNRQWLGLTFLVCIILWGVAVISDCWGWLSNKIFQRKVEKHIIRRLNSLTEDEKQILRYYIAMNTRANMLKVDDGVVQGLVADRIIYRSASMGNILEGFAHNITDLVWDYIHENPKILQGTTNFYRTGKRERGW
ncbi:MAG: superinfection exclusion B family protein [Actinobacteria bacterium]|nr:superinfection exclusion B family protein [Actinomycetota bacterium]